MGAQEQGGFESLASLDKAPPSYIESMEETNGLSHHTTLRGESIGSSIVGEIDAKKVMGDSILIWT